MKNFPLRPTLPLLGCGLIAAAGLLFTAACTSVLPEAQVDSVRYFSMSGATEPGAVPHAVTVRPVQLSGHLRNRTLAMRVMENEITYLEDIRWAEPLDEGITVVLSEKLGQISGNEVFAVKVHRCELTLVAGKKHVEFSATYTLTAAGGEMSVGSYRSPAREWDGRDYAWAIQTLRSEVQQLAESMAEHRARLIVEKK
jgi:uncharacterized lipoprotein YmbA